MFLEHFPKSQHCLSPSPPGKLDPAMWGCQVIRRGGSNIPDELLKGDGDLLSMTMQFL